MRSMHFLWMFVLILISGCVGIYPELFRQTDCEMTEWHQSIDRLADPPFEERSVTLCTD